MSSSAESIQFMRDKWQEIGSNEQICRAFILECREHISEGGGVLWIKYETCEKTAQPKWAFVPNDSELYVAIPRYVTNFELLTKDYDPEKHCLIFLSVPHTESSMYGQMTRVNYEEGASPAISLDPNSQGKDGTWTFCLS